MLCSKMGLEEVLEARRYQVSFSSFDWSDITWGHRVYLAPKRHTPVTLPFPLKEDKSTIYSSVTQKSVQTEIFLIVECTVIKLLEGWIPSYFESSLYIFRKKCLSSAKITIFFFSEGAVTNPAF